MNLFVYFISAIFAVVGASVMVSGVNELHLAQASTSWPVAEGKIVHSTIKSSRDSDSTTYQPIVRFTYQANGQEFRGNQVFFGNLGISSSNITYSRKITQKYPRGQTVKVFYHPSEPQLSVLEVGLTKKSFIGVTFGALFFLIGSGIGILWWLFEGSE